MSDGFDASTSALQGGAAGLAAEGTRLGGLGGEASGAASAAAGGVNGGALAGALSALGAELATRCRDLAEATDTTAQNVTTAAATYRSTDAAAGTALGQAGSAMPGG